MYEILFSGALSADMCAFGFNGFAHLRITSRPVLFVFIMHVFCRKIILPWPGTW